MQSSANAGQPGRIFRQKPPDDIVVSQSPRGLEAIFARHRYGARLRERRAPCEWPLWRACIEVPPILLENTPTAPHHPRDRGPHSPS
jgi:hypothetical protein